MGLIARLRRVHVHFVLALLALALARPTATTNIIGTVLVVIGMAVRIWAAGVLEKGGDLCTRGPYSWVRHPLYLGSSIGAFGICIMANSLWGWAVILPVFAALYAAQMRYEEQRLREEFSDAHREWARSAPLIVPRLRRGAFGAWQPRRVLVNREQNHIAVTSLLVLLFYLRHLWPQV